ncbi:MATE family efflux transporter [bacterium]|nr:MATE family efflux transporter [bacterium]
MTDTDSTSDGEPRITPAGEVGRFLLEDSPPVTGPADPSSRILSGDLRSAVLFLALPVLAEQFLNFLVSFVDTYLSGRLSAEATSAIGTAAYVNWLAELLYSMIGIGTTALVARHWGRGERSEATRAASSALSLSIVFGSVAVVLMLIVAPVFGGLLGMTGESFDLTVRYLRLSAVGHLFSCMTLVGASALRGAGNMRSPMWILGMVSVLNVFFSSGLVFGVGPLPALGMDGIAYGTVAARGVGCAAMVWVLLRGLTELRPSVQVAAFRDSETVRRILKVGTPAAADSLLMWIGHFVFLWMIWNLDAGSTSSATYAAHIVGVQVEAMNYMPAWAWGTAAATLIGQSLGAGLPLRARAGGLEAVLQASLLALGISLLFYFGAGRIYELMHEDPAVSEVGAPAMRLLAFFELPLAVAIVYAVGVRGAGATFFPMAINFAGIFLVRLPLAWLLAHEYQLGLWGAWLGMGIDVALRAIAMATYFHRGRWIETKV